MLNDPTLKKLKRRQRELKSYGYDVPSSRRFFWKISGIRDGKVLEIGTGKGFLTTTLARKGLRPVSIDRDKETLRVARLHLKALGLDKRAKLRKMNAEKLSFSPRSFDHVISMDFFHHAKNPLLCLREMMRVTRRTLAIADLNRRGMRIMDLVHKAEGKCHETPSLPFRELGGHLRKKGFIVKYYRHTCHQIFTAKRRNP